MDKLLVNLLELDNVAFISKLNEPDIEALLANNVCAVIDVDSALGIDDVEFNAAANVMPLDNAFGNDVIDLFNDAKLIVVFKLLVSFAVAFNDDDMLLLVVKSLTNELFAPKNVTSPGVYASSADHH